MASALAFTAVPTIASRTEVSASAAQKDFFIVADGVLFGAGGYKMLPGKYKMADYSVLNLAYMGSNGDGGNITNYSFKTNSKNLSMTKKTVTAKKAGTYKVTLTAKYKKETTTRNLKVTFANLAFKKTKTDVVVGDNFSIDSLFKGKLIGSTKCSIIEGKEFVSLKKKSGSYNIYGVKEGTAKIKVTDYYGKNPATITVNVSPNHCTSITTKYANKAKTVYSSEREYVSDIFDINAKSSEVPVSDPITVTTSNPEIVKVEQNEDGDYYLVAVTSGNATVTLTCGDYSATAMIKSVIDDEE